MLYHLDDTNFESNGYYENIDDQLSQKSVSFISLQEKDSYTTDIIYSSSPPTITPYQTTYKETTESEYDSIPAEELYVSIKDLHQRLIIS